MYQVLYFSRGGNTKMVADVIAKELGVAAEDVKSSRLDPNAAIIFLGSGCYGQKPGADAMRFIETSDFGGRKVALFGTSSWGAGVEVEAMAKSLRQKGATVLGSYYCKGEFLLMVARGHPDRSDLDDAGKFARQMAKGGK